MSWNDKLLQYLADDLDFSTRWITVRDKMTPDSEWPEDRQARYVVWARRKSSKEKAEQKAFDEEVKRNFKKFKPR